MIYKILLIASCLIFTSLSSCSHSIMDKEVIKMATITKISHCEDVYDNGETSRFREIECKINIDNRIKTFTLYDNYSDEMGKPKANQLLMVRVKKTALETSSTVIDSSDVLFLNIVPQTHRNAL